MSRQPFFGPSRLPNSINDAMPLMSVDAVVLDTETTSLDAQRARVIQIGAARIGDGMIVDGEQLDLLVNPEMPVPASSTAIHGLKDEDLAPEPPFAAVVPGLERFIGDALLIGHNIGFDLTILKHEYGRAGLNWRCPRVLDTFMLARVARPSLAEFTLEAIAGWLGVSVEGRHTAIGDALTTARIFLALVPHLRACGVRTIAEAETASSGFPGVANEFAQLGWVTPDSGRERQKRHRALAQIDSFPFRHKVRDIMSSPLVKVGPKVDIANAARLLVKANVSSAIVVPNVAGAGYGIVTERDLMRALARAAKTSELPSVGDVMSAPFETVSGDAFISRAIGQMRRMGVRHLGVVDADEVLTGIMTNSDLLRQRAGDAILLGDEIELAPNTAALAAAWGRIPIIARLLMDEAVMARDIAALVADELCCMTRRAAELSEAEMMAEGKGGPPVPYCLLVLGSGGRGESLLSPDQDNAIIYASGEPEGPEDAWFSELGARISNTLDEAGIPYCKGGVMAKAPEWRHSAAVWYQTIDTWIGRSQSKDLLSVDIFFDYRAVYGDQALASDLWRHACSLGSRSPGFLKQLAAASTQFNPAFGLFGGIRTVDGRADLKWMGLLPLVNGARLLALRHGFKQRSTVARIEAVRALDIYNDEDLANLAEAHHVLLGETLAQQLADIEAGVPPSNKVAVRLLSKRHRSQLKWALQQVEKMTSIVGIPLSFGEIV